LAYYPTNDRLFVGDDFNDRLLVFNLSGGITNGMAASAVIGVPDFTTNGYTANITSQTTIEDPEIGMTYDTGDNRLWMTDDSNNRVLAWDLVKVTTSSLTSGTTGQSYNQTLSASQSQGTLTWVVTSGSLPAGLSLNSASGVISGTPATAGTSNFTVAAQDALSAAQTFTDSAGLTITVAQGTTQTPTPSGGGGMIVGSGPLAPSAAGLPGYKPPRPQIDYPNGSVVYLGATTTASTTTITPTPSAPSTAPSVSSPTPSAFPHNLQLWDTGNDVLQLQQFLNTHGFTIAKTGVGSAGNETDTFGLYTYAALIKFQEANNLPATGFLGPLTRAALMQTSPVSATTTDTTSGAQ
jgi:hypothetical protein